ncbi:MAG: hypothetical protein NTX50_12485 [Candidatus Sumerlaeota bacterium]|nr:hypothetical protein [Candidatus Sumerlaeota bacterium]
MAEVVDGAAAIAMTVHPATTNARNDCTAGNHSSILPTAFFPLTAKSLLERMAAYMNIENTQGN